MATSSNIPAWKIPWTEEPSRLHEHTCMAGHEDLKDRPMLPALNSRQTMKIRKPLRQYLKGYLFFVSTKQTVLIIRSRTELEGHRATQKTEYTVLTSLLC